VISVTACAVKSRVFTAIFSKRILRKSLSSKDLTSHALEGKMTAQEGGMSHEDPFDCGSFIVSDVHLEHGLRSAICHQHMGKSDRLGIDPAKLHCA
jgi:hypothetical protein